MMTGGGIAESLGSWQVIIAAVLGTITLCAFAAAQGVLGTRRRGRFAAVTRYSLGVQGARRVAAPVLAVMMIGWFGFNTSLAGDGLGALIGVPHRVGVLIFAAAMMIVAWRGLDVLSHAALIAGGATVLLAAGGLHLALRDHSGPLLDNGSTGGGLAVLSAVGVVVGYGAAFALRSPDFTYDLRRQREVVWNAALGLGLPLVVFLIVGAILQTATGTWNLVEILEQVGSPTIGYAFIALGFTGSVLSNLYSGAVALEESDADLSHQTGLLITGVLGTVLALIDFSDHMIPFLTTMALAAPCLIAVLWVDEIRRTHNAQASGRSALAGWAAGGAVGAMMAFVARPWALAAGLVAAATVHLMGSSRTLK